jgi:uncharacterized protein (TIGR03435 family)
MKSALLAAGLVLVGACWAQTESLRFDVASVKPNVSGPTSMLWAYRGRRFTARYATAKALIHNAYGEQEHSLADSQIAGGPDWLDSDRFDVEATAPAVPDSPRGTFPPPVLAMLRSLLEERFQLQTHVKKEELPIFALVLARSDGTLGPRLRRRTTDCAVDRSATREPANLFNPTPAERRACDRRIGPGTLMASGATMTNIISALPILVPGLNRVVVDNTGLTGQFDVDLTWSFETTADALGVPFSSRDLNAPSVFTALQEQLGLKLESRKGPVDILVIDQIEHPTAD